MLKSLFKNPTQVFTEIVFEIFRNRFFIEHFWWLLLKKCFITIHSTENTSNREEILNGKLHFLCNKASIIFWAYLYFIKIICRVWDRYRISSKSAASLGIHTDASSLISAAPLNTELIRIVTIFY